MDLAPGSAGTPGSEEEAEDDVVTSSYFNGNANQRRKRKRLPNVGVSKRKKTSSGGSQQFHSKGYVGCDHMELFTQGNVVMIPELHIYLVIVWAHVQLGRQVLSLKAHQMSLWGFSVPPVPP